MFTLDRFTHFPSPPRRARARAGRWPAHRRLWTHRVERLRGVLLTLCGIGIAAVAGWMLAGGDLSSTQVLFGQPDAAALPSSGRAPVHVETSPSGAQVRMDGTTYGKTPLDLRLSPGQHTLNLQH